MFDISVAHLNPVHVTELVVTASDQRYCPVYTRGQQQYLEQVHPKKNALVAKKQKVVLRYHRYRGEDFTTREAAKMAAQFVPEISKWPIKEAQGYFGVVGHLPNPIFYPGDVVEWNDLFIDRLHPARLAIGEGPFVVKFGNDLIAAFSKERGFIYTREEKHVVVIRPDSDGVVVCRAGYFKKKEESA